MVELGDELLGPEIFDRLLAARMLRLPNQLPGAKTPHDTEVLQRQIDTTDRQIDRVVYELYDLTDEEIQIVEEATREG